MINEEDFQGVCKGINNWECAYILWKDENYICQTNNDGIYGYWKVVLA